VSDEKFNSINSVERGEPTSGRCGRASRSVTLSDIIATELLVIFEEGK